MSAARALHARRSLVNGKRSAEQNKRRAWVRVNHYRYTIAAAADLKGVRQSTLRADEKALDLRFNREPTQGVKAAKAAAVKKPLKEITPAMRLAFQLPWGSHEAFKHKLEPIP